MPCVISWGRMALGGAMGALSSAETMCHRVIAAPIALCHPVGGVGVGKVFLVCLSFSQLQLGSSQQ